MGLNWRIWLTALPLFILLALGLHYASFSAPMYYDSFGQLQAKEHIFASGDILKVVQIFPQRPVAMVSFYLNYLIWGMDPYYFRVVNILLLALTAFTAALDFVLISEATSSTASVSSVERQIVALSLGVVFLVHPVQTYFVAYIWQRMGLLASLFYFLAFAAYLSARMGRIRRPIWGYVICGVCFALALASKENAVTLPLILLLAEIAFFWDGWKNLLKRAGVLAGIALLLVAALSILERPHGLPGQSSGIFATVSKYYAESGLTPFQVIISQCRVLFSYLTMIGVPVSSNLRLMTANVIYSSPLESPIITAAVLGAMGILGAGIYLLRRRPLTGFGLLFFFVGLMPESLLVPQYSFFAYRVILPMFGMLVVLGDGLLEVLARTKSLAGRKRYLGPLAAGFMLTVALVSAATIGRAKLWCDPVAFWTDIVEGLPHYEDKVEKRITIHALTSLSAALYVKNRTTEAIDVLKRVLEVDPNSAVAYGQLGEAYRFLGDFDQSEFYLRKAVEIDPNAATLRSALAEFYLAQDKLSEAWKHMQRAAELVPSDPKYLIGLGRILARQGKESECVPYFLQAIKVSPGSDEARYHLGEAYVSMGMDTEAENQFRKALDLKSQNWRAHYSLGLLLAKSGNISAATANFSQALALNPSNWRVHNNLGALFAKSGNLQQAAVHFQEALRLNPNDIAAKKNLERIRRLRGTSPVR